MSKLDSDKNDLMRDLAGRVRAYPQIEDSTRIKTLAVVDDIFIHSSNEEFLTKVKSYLEDTEKMKEMQVTKGPHEFSMEEIIQNIESIERKKEKMHILFHLPMTFGAIAILSSIVLLSLGQIEYPAQSLESTYPFSLLYNVDDLHILKMLFFSTIIYFATVSIIGSMIFLDELLDVSYE